MTVEYKRMCEEFRDTGWNYLSEGGKPMVEIWSMLRPGLPGKYLFGKEAADYANRRSLWDNAEFDDEGNLVTA
jgi:hypothetical protein